MDTLPKNDADHRCTTCAGRGTVLVGDPACVIYGDENCGIVGETICPACEGKGTVTETDTDRRAREADARVFAPINERGNQ